MFEIVESCLICLLSKVGSCYMNPIGTNSCCWPFGQNVSTLKSAHVRDHGRIGGGDDNTISPTVTF